MQVLCHGPVALSDGLILHSCGGFFVVYVYVCVWILGAGGVNVRCRRVSSGSKAGGLRARRGMGSKDKPCLREDARAKPGDLPSLGIR